MRLFFGLAAACLPLLAAPAFAGCADEIQAVMAGLAEAGPVRLVATIEGKDGTIKTVIEKVPGAMHARRDDGGVVSEYTLVGDRAWTREGGEWIELPAETAAGYAASLKADGMTFEGIADAQCLGIDPRTFYQSYRLIYVDIGARTRATLLADPQTGLPRVLQTWSIGGEKSTTISRFTYDPSITVVAPR